jgi:hypothetical protein
MSDHKSSQSRN